jgi:erythronate-4-phosphate dehydrogenase
MKVIADDKIPFLEGVLEPFIDMEYIPGDQITPERVRDADALLIRTRTKCDARLLEGSSVKFIGTATIGFDHIDTGYCKQRGIAWSSAPGCNAGSVNQYIASALISLSRQKGFRLKDRVLGIVGVGNVGSKILKTAEMFNMRIYLCDPPRVRKEGICGFLSLDSIIRECDIITFHVPLNLGGQDKTFHMAGDDFFSGLNPGTILINSSRGEIMDTGSLIKSISSGRLGGLVLDVWENEPDINRDLLAMTTIATPHIAGYSADGKAKGTAMVIQALSKFFGLGIDDWQPEYIPMPENKVITLDCQDMDVETAMGEAILTTYNVLRDDQRLKQSADTFEKQRGAYPLRREFQSFSVKVLNDHSDIRYKIMKMGFKVI